MSKYSSLGSGARDLVMDFSHRKNNLLNSNGSL